MTTHLMVDEVECPTCETPAGYSCTEWRYGQHVDLDGFHADRYWAAELHTTHHNPVLDSDIIIITCDECDLEDAQ